MCVTMQRCLFQWGQEGDGPNKKIPEQENLFAPPTKKIGKGRHSKKAWKSTDLHAKFQKNFPWNSHGPHTRQYTPRPFPSALRTGLQPLHCSLPSPQKIYLDWCHSLSLCHVFPRFPTISVFQFTAEPHTVWLTVSLTMHCYTPKCCIFCYIN